jgi:lysophospholipase L1-like esterase
MKRRRAIVLCALGLGALYAEAARRGIAPGRAVVGDVARSIKRTYDRRGARGEAFDRWDVENNAAPPGAVVFLGSSTIARGPWAELFPNAACLNRGLGDENAIDAAARLEESLPRARPGGIVLYAGSADLRVDEASPSESIARVEALVLKLVEALPGVPIAILDLLPEVGATEARRAELDVMSDGLMRIAAAAGASFVRTRLPPIVDSKGDLASEAAADKHHLNAFGYRALAARLALDGGAVAAALGAR